ncbi:hypothetical protein CAEBREN_22548 [Caenorhabditis brenneri]|uniref:SPK domain-containing protein n=1 Tax=Caenorhabditis brenneri TaxID=135651 RepID=G0PCI1_CAEBE|nr:hypothetical protein CAEBREN_22548 [Caenorhabditis brenneri]
MRAVAADKKRRMSQIHVKNEIEKPKATGVISETEEKAEKLTEIVDSTLDSEDQDQSAASSTKSELLESKSSNSEALSEKSRSESKKKKSGGSSEHSDGKSLVSKHPEPQNSIRRAPSVKSELSKPKTSNVEASSSKFKLPGPKSSLTVAPPTSKAKKEKDKSKNSDGKSIVSKHPVPISEFFPKISKAPTTETKLLESKSSNTSAPPTSETEEKEEDDSEDSDESLNVSEEESISEIEEPPKRQVSGSKSESIRSESVKIQMSGYPTAPKSTDVSVESETEAENNEDVTENSDCDEEDVEEEEKESSDESSKNSEDESIAKPPNSQISDSESVNEAENSEESELTENSDCDEEDVEECSVEDEEKEEESEIHQTPPFRPQTSNGNLSIPPNAHIRFLKSIMVFMSNLELRELDYLYERIEDRILEIKERCAMNSEKEVSINEIRTCLMTCFLIVTKSATASTKSVRTKESVRSQESWMNLTSFLKLYKRFVTSLKWKSLENFEQNLRNKIEELDEQDKRIPSSKVAFALQTIIEIVAP